MQHPAWTLVVIGLAVAGIGAVWLLAPHMPWLGGLPGDIAVEGKGFRFYFPDPMISATIHSIPHHGPEPSGRRVAFQVGGKEANRPIRPRG